MNNNTDTITISRDAFRAMVAINITAEGLLNALQNQTSLIPFQTERLAQNVARLKAVREAERAAIGLQVKASRERTAQILADRDLGVD